MTEITESNFYGLRLRAELFTVLRHAGLDLLAYDGALCREAAPPLAEAARRIETDPALRDLFRSVVGCDDETVSNVLDNLKRVARKCARRSAVILRVRTLEGYRPGSPS
jgi:hypothetical protein